MVYHGLLEYYVMKVCHGKTPLVCDSGSSGSYAGLLRPYTDAHGNARTHGNAATHGHTGAHMDSHPYPYFDSATLNPTETPKPTRH